ncbi:nitrite reductase (NAD(P)H) small subunit [Streptomyces sp. NPDC017949]|uniref:nitrite reductase (NAD(P)H) small subunit n=1 Tax=Streptomyces sp. NPDC017949 TaxID=3365020 RepID=UPI0037ACE3ED
MGPAEADLQKDGSHSVVPRVAGGEITAEQVIALGEVAGQVYGKSLRAVKSFVGARFRRFGQGDSIKLAIDLELRYRGLRTPHKFKDEWQAVLEDPEALERFGPVDPGAVAPGKAAEGGLEPGRGRSVRLADGAGVAVFKDRAGAVYAVGNRDPFSGADVISDGIVGSRDGVPVVTSPMRKQVFDLRAGICLDDPRVSLPVVAPR